MTTPSQAVQTGYHSADDLDIGELARLANLADEPDRYRHAMGIEGGVVVYDANALSATPATGAGRRAVMSEIAYALGPGPGAVLFRSAMSVEVVERASAAFDTMIVEEAAGGATAADHFAVAGANDRVWNTFEKLAVAAPDVFVDYFRCSSLALGAEAWLGPGYQISSQVNVVKPGGAAQSPHRDYHLGFMSNAEAEQFPAHVHWLSPALTLQGAVAHVDMPIESGPTKLLPHSQKFPAGYVAWRDPRVIELFEANFVQVALAAGDLLFFNPAVLHAGGQNRTPDVQRMANLFQISSAFGRAMENIDRARIVRSIYPTLLKRQEDGWDSETLATVVAAAAHGYAFPGNLDRDPPTDAGLAPASQAVIVSNALAAGWPIAELTEALDALEMRQRT